MRHAYFEQDPLRLIASCPICSHKYEPFRAKMVGVAGNSHMWYVMCSMCRHALLVSVLVNEEGVNSVGILTDLQFDEVIRFRNQSVITANDCIALHQALSIEEEL